MKVCVVSFDLHHPVQVYQPLFHQLERMKFERLQPHLWAGSCEFTPADLKSAVLRRLCPEDGVFVFSQDSERDDYASHNPLK
jgi:hypothetical protein